MIDYVKGLVENVISLSYSVTACHARFSTICTPTKLGSNNSKLLIATAASFRFNC